MTDTLVAPAAGREHIFWSGVLDPFSKIGRNFVVGELPPRNLHKKALAVGPPQAGADWLKLGRVGQGMDSAGTPTKLALTV